MSRAPDDEAGGADANIPESTVADMLDGKERSAADKNNTRRDLEWALKRTPNSVCDYVMDPTSPLHQLFLKRMENDRDLKIIITAKDAQTGVGKSTLAFALAASWHSIYTGEEWSADEYATFDVSEYLQRYRDVQSGSVLLMEEAEQLDSRRSMASENVDFSHYWMAMRVRQVVSILTLPSTSALDKRLWELADVWINVECRGRAAVYRIGINSFDGEMYTKHVYDQGFPDVSSHPEMKAIDRMKEEKIERGLAEMDSGEDEIPDPDEVERQEKKRVAQQLRASDADLSGEEIGEIVGRSDTWVYNNTEKPDIDQPTKSP